MADQIISFQPQNDERFRRALESLGKTVSDFRIPLGLISRDWYRSNKIIFGLASRGLYEDLGGFNPNLKDRKWEGQPVTRREYAKRSKLKAVGFVYPLLKRTGAIEASMSGPNAKGAEFFLGKQTLIMGTNISYAKYHQSDRTPRLKLPQRKLVFISGGPGETAQDSRINGRLERWLNIVNDHIRQVITGRVDV